MWLTEYKAWFFNQNSNGYKKGFFMKVLGRPFQNTCKIFNNVLQSEAFLSSLLRLWQTVLKSLKLTRQAVDIVRLHWCFCKLEHIMCYLNVQAGITIENAYWLFVIAKKTWRVFLFAIRLWKDNWSRFLRDTLQCYSPQVGSIMNI
jgi:hypothetical protein